MTNYNSKHAFERLFKESYFTRVDSEHPLDLWLGVDAQGRKALRFTGEFTPAKVNGTHAVEVRQFVLGQGKCIQFSLAEPDSADLFYTFCNDLIDSSRTNANQAGGYHFVTTRFSRWKHMFVAKRDILSEKEIMGLLGELYFLTNHLSQKYGQTRAINSWSASDPTLKDFSIDGLWYEVKTTGPKSKTVHIGSLQQLEFDSPGRLIAIRMEKMSGEYGGLSLNSMVTSFLKSLSHQEDCERFEVDLNLRGYVYNEKYDDYVYAIRDMMVYKVDESFPRLKKENLTDAISDAEYELVLEKLESFRCELEGEK